jgi:predicted  nucleic acid-binding Zn-ribbon protein
MIPPDWQCTSCGFIVIASGSAPRGCPRCGKAEFTCIGNRPGYDPAKIQEPYRIQIPAMENILSPSSPFPQPVANDIICTRCGFLFSGGLFDTIKCNSCGSTQLVWLGPRSSYDLRTIREKYPDRPELQKEPGATPSRKK